MLKLYSIIQQEREHFLVRDIKLAENFFIEFMFSLFAEMAKNL